MKAAYLFSSAALKKVSFLLAITFLYSTSVYAVWMDRTDKGGVVKASSQIHEGEAMEMAFDNTTSTKWLTDHTSTGWLQFQFPNNQQYSITRYSISSANDAQERDPYNWTLYGSNDEETWTVVDTKEGETWTDRWQRREFICDSPGAYNFYKLDITANRVASSNLTGFSEMELLEDVFQAQTPTPADNSEGILYYNPTLSWEGPSELATPEYAIYLSDDLSLVEQSDPSVLVAQQFETSLSVGYLDTFTTYYWRVNVINGGHAGDVWQFQTEQPSLDCLTLTGDIDNDCQVDMSELELIAAQWLAEACPAGPCADIDDSSKVDMADLAKVSDDWSKEAGTIVLHEIMADNETTLADNFGEYPDWIEIRNLGNTAQNLEGWYLTDDDEQLDKWVFPSVEISPKGYLIVFASGLDLTDDPEYLHLNFKLSKGGQYLALVRPDMSIAHEFSPEYPELGNDEAYGLTLLSGEESFVTSLLASPTPNASNASAVVWGKPEFSVPSGIYEDALTLELSYAKPGYEIRYTLDGSLPTGISELYTGPLTVSHSTCIRASAYKEKYLPGKPATQTFIFLDDVAQQSALPDGFPDYWKATEADYEMDPDIVGDPVYGPQLKSSLLSLPTISIVTDQDNLFDSNIGIYSNPTQEGVSWERPAHVELITQDGSDEFQIDCGLRIQGGAFRRFDLTRKKSFRLVFKREYGNGKLNFPLFDYDPDASESYDTITLRAGANDGYSWSTGYLTEQYIRDEFGRSVQCDSGNAGSHGTFFHLYLNGLYWGLYNAVERPDNSFSATYNGGDKDDWDAINAGDLSEGSMDAWNSLVSKCQSGMSTMEAYEEIQGNNADGSRNPEYPVLIDMANYIDYITINMWGGNGDWPHRNYWVGRDRSEDSEGFQFYCWDYEGTISSPFAQYNKVTADLNSGAGIPHNYLRANSEYKVLFGDRVHKLFFNGGALTTDVNIQRYTDLANWVEPAIIAESARWADQHHTDPPSLDEWIAKRDDILTNYLPTRSDIVLQQLRDAGYYPDLDAPVFNVNGTYQYGGYVESGDVLTMASTVSGVGEMYLVPESYPVYIYVPIDDTLGLSWTAPEFVPDSSWTDGTTVTGVGYERSSGYEDLIGTDMHDAMYGVSTSVYCRMEFSCESVAQVQGLVLEMKYDDGFIAYLNGVEVCRTTNITSDVPGSASARNHEAGYYYEEFDITSYINLLNTGTNVLAIHGINYSTTSSDMIIMPQLKMQYESVPVYYTTDGTDPRLLGGEVNPSAKTYYGPISMTESCLIKARVYVNEQWSALNEAQYAVGPVADSLRITEIMYNPSTDPNSEFIELMNIGVESINLNQAELTKGVEFIFGSLEVAPGDRVVVVRNIDAFTAQYPDFSGVIAGEYSGSLDNGGERIKLIDVLGTEILDFDYKDSWYDITDGEGFSLVIKDPLASDITLWDDKSGWRPGAVPGGTPGTDDSDLIPAIGSIVFNEILSHSDQDEYDWIELYNTTDEPINIGGWYLSDNNDDDAKRKKYQIAEGTVIKAHDYKVFYENLHFGNIGDSGCSIPFQLSENGETIYLQSGSNGVLTGYYQEEEFGAAERDIAFGRYQKSDGGINFVAMSSNTPGDDNAYPKVGPVIITEIMYHPEDDGDAEYVELQNISGSPVPLYDYETGAAWRFVDNKDDIGVEFYFPVDSPVVLAANEKILLVKNLAAFSDEFGEPASGLKIFEWLDGSLSNGSEKPELQMPGDVDESMTRYYIRIDRVSYDDESPWPTEADGDGYSLERISTTVYGNDPASWQAASPTPGS